jgi:hypothetical protein
LHENAPAHQTLATQNKLAYLGFQCLDHPPYYPGMVPSDYHLFPGLKNPLKLRRFSPDVEVIVTAVTKLEGQLPEIFKCLAKVRATS